MDRGCHQRGYYKDGTQAKRVAVFFNPLCAAFRELPPSLRLYHPLRLYHHGAVSAYVSHARDSDCGMDVPCKKTKSKHHTAADPVSEAEWCPPPPPVPGTHATLLDTQIRSLAQLIEGNRRRSGAQGRAEADHQAGTQDALRWTKLVAGGVRLIGSAALGLALPTSDVDLTVLGRSEAGRSADL